jgi:hypothetical protein
MPPCPARGDRMGLPALAWRTRDRHQTEAQRARVNFNQAEATTFRIGGHKGANPFQEVGAVSPKSVHLEGTFAGAAFIQHSVAK